MAWNETFHCDVCGKEKSEESEDWWLAWPETLSPAEGEAEQQVMKVTRWNGFLAHSADVRHLCGAQCVHRHMDRWMLARS
ncbi:MAG TPA: hypothetical protein VHU89_02440 [Acidobacteriaceae bacterium]|jgi:hypothetical protein|nr:hypothetical protein [Acidobacteriaceae bacterium]